MKVASKLTCQKNEKICEYSATTGQKIDDATSVEVSDQPDSLQEPKERSYSGNNTYIT